jgi:hypothetical protein
MECPEDVRNIFSVMMMMMMVIIIIIIEHLWSSVRFQGYNFQCGKPNHQPSSISSNMAEVC